MRSHTRHYVPVLSVSPCPLGALPSVPVSLQQCLKTWLMNSVLRLQQSSQSDLLHSVPCSHSCSALRLEALLTEVFIEATCCLLLLSLLFSVERCQDE